MEILFCWIGSTDLKCAEMDEPDSFGPIVQALRSLSFDRVVLLASHPEGRVSNFYRWMSSQSETESELHPIQLSSPMNYKEIYEAARIVVRGIHTQWPEAKLTFHTSPGTSAMAASWLLLAPHYGAKLIDSSIDHGVNQVYFPFEIAASFLPDQDITRLAVDETPPHPAFADILHQSQTMRSLVEQAQYVAARGDITVLIEGESGTGKELFAKAIHNASHRATQPFKAINCGAIPTELVESQLFGHEKGAFTGADSASPGLFRSAEKGTVFLDEIGELPLQHQVKLLRALNEREVLSIGASRPISINVRVIAAGNRNLLREVAEGRFRSDLFYRLAVAVLKLPPLRERGEDIPLLLANALESANKEFARHGDTKYKKFSEPARKILLAYPWPGNVREMNNTIMRAALWSRGEIITEENARQALLALPEIDDSLPTRPLGNGFSLDELLAKIEAHYLERATAESGNIKTKAAALLGFSNYQTFSNRLKKYSS